MKSIWSVLAGWFVILLLVVTILCGLKVKMAKGDYSPIMKAEIGKDCKQCEYATTSMKALQDQYTALVDDRELDFVVAAQIECEVLGEWLDVGWWIVNNCPDVYDRWTSAITAARNCRAANYSKPEEFLNRMAHQRKAVCAVANPLGKYKLIWIQKWPGLGA